MWPVNRQCNELAVVSCCVTLCLPFTSQKIIVCTPISFSYVHSPSRLHRWISGFHLYYRRGIDVGVEVGMEVSATCTIFDINIVHFFFLTVWRLLCSIVLFSFLFGFSGDC